MINLDKLCQNVGLVNLVQTSCVAVQSIVHLDKTIHGAHVLHLTLNTLVRSARRSRIHGPHGHLLSRRSDVLLHALDKRLPRKRVIRICSATCSVQEANLQEKTKLFELLFFGERNAESDAMLIHLICKPPRAKLDLVS